MVLFKSTKILAVIVLIVLLNACATTSTNNQRFEIFDNYITDSKLESVSKIRAFQFRGWKSLDDKHLIVSSSFKNQYLITINGFCQNLSFANQIGLKQTMNNSLSAKFDSIVVKDDFNQECRIKTIHKIDKAQEEELVQLRKNYRRKSESKNNQ